MRIFFFASFGDFNEIPAGGGQTAARRLLILLKALGYEVNIYNRHRSSALKGLRNKIYKLFWGVFDPICFGCKLLFKRRNDSIVFFMTYAGSLIPFDFFISTITRILCFRTIEYLAGGGTKKLYEKGSHIYRTLFRWTTRNFYEVMLEGTENISLIKNVSNVRTFHLPNFTEDGFAPTQYPAKGKDTVNIIYFGRICEEKNILLSLDIFDEICKHNESLCFTIIGNGPDEYVRKVENRIAESKNSHKIIRIDKVNHEALRKILVNQHIYLFPSNEPREGHSNALNEAMSWGVIPIVSSNNFLPSIVGDSFLVAKDFETVSYVQILLALINDKNLLSTKSHQVYERVRDNFTQSIVKSNLEHELKEIFNRKK